MVRLFLLTLHSGQAVEQLRQRGYKIHCGRWLVDGNPQIILFDVGSASHKMSEFKQVSSVLEDNFTI